MRWILNIYIEISAFIIIYIILQACKVNKCLHGRIRYINVSYRSYTSKRYKINVIIWHVYVRLFYMIHVHFNYFNLRKKYCLWDLGPRNLFWLAIGYNYEGRIEVTYYLIYLVVCLYSALWLVLLVNFLFIFIFWYVSNKSCVLTTRLIKKKK